MKVLKVLLTNNEIEDLNRSLFAGRQELDISIDLNKKINNNIKDHVYVKQLITKGDYMEVCQDLNEEIRVIDSSIPLKVQKDLQRLNIDHDNFCMVYFKNGTNKVIDIISYYTVLKGSYDAN